MMSDSCQQFRHLLEVYCDGQLEPSTVVAIEDHLGSCESCRERIAFQRAVATSVRREVRATPIPEDARARFMVGDWAEGVRERFDLILCNPPYVEAGAPLPRDVAEWEPHEALFAGEGGLSEYRRLAPIMPGLLAPGGIACVEIGLGQQEAVTALFEAAGLKVETRQDLAGHVRCLVLSHRVQTPG